MFNFLKKKEEVKPARKMGILFCPPMKITPEDTQMNCNLCGMVCFSNSKAFRSVNDWESGKTADIQDYDVKYLCHKCVMCIVGNFNKNLEQIGDIMQRATMLQVGPDGKMRLNG